MSKKILVNGAWGRMGQEVVKTVINDTEDLLVGACDKKNTGQNIVQLLGLEGESVIIQDDLEKAIRLTEPDVIIDFTAPQVVMNNIRIGLRNGIDMIVGTTGITEVDMQEIKELTEKFGVNALVVPNFALGAVLMMRFAAEAARYLTDVEIIELHHQQKIDAPSGTAIKTAELINGARRKDSSIQENKQKNSIEEKTADEDKTAEIEKITGARGGQKDEIHIHSVRLPGLVAHQEVIFGAEGQSLTIRHDSYHRSSFMPGVRIALNKIKDLNGFVYGLENILE